MFEITKMKPELKNTLILFDAMLCLDLWIFNEVLDLNFLSQRLQGYDSPSMCLHIVSHDLRKLECYPHFLLLPIYSAPATISI